MSEENFSSTSHLPAAMTTTEIDQVQSAGGTGMTSSSTRGPDFYFEVPVVIIGTVGAAANALVVYAMIASNQHKKQLLIFNQNLFDLCICLLDPAGMYR